MSDNVGMRAPWGLSPSPTWTNRFLQLGPAFYTRWSATPLPEPAWVATSDTLAQTLGWPTDWQQHPGMLDILAGNQPWPGSEPWASVYSGHQFGVWAGQLGDGRALCLGEIETAVGPQEIQLKGAGPTPYSRRADGRAVLRSSIREFLCSEAMHGLGIPTTRALALISSPAKVLRESVESAAVVTRVAPSFLRFGHFEHFAALDRRDELERLLDHCIQHLHLGKDQLTNAAHPALALLQDVVNRTADMIACWQAVGFCHGVMNTDNMSLLGLTLDYGPFQFMDAYDPAHICNHTDTQGRYAFGRQPRIAHWNLHALGQALVPLVGDTDALISVLDTYPDRFQEAWLNRMRAKLGGLSPAPDDGEFIQQLLQWMSDERCDHTLFWRRLSLAVSHWQAGQEQDRAFEPVLDLAVDRDRLQSWLQRYQQRLQHTHLDGAGAHMLRTNPKYVLRNHLAQMAIEAAQAGDPRMVRQLLDVLQSPYDEHPEHDDWAGWPPDWAQHIEISCSS